MGVSVSPMTDELVGLSIMVVRFELNVLNANCGPMNRRLCGPMWVFTSMSLIHSLVGFALACMCASEFGAVVNSDDDGDDELEIRLFGL